MGWQDSGDALDLHVLDVQGANQVQQAGNQRRRDATSPTMKGTPMNKFVDPLRKGESLANPAASVKRGLLMMIVGGSLSVAVRVARAQGYEVSFITDEVVDMVAGVIVSAVLLYFGAAASPAIGVLPSRPGADDGVQDGPEATDDPKSDVHGGP
jgi:hypothetical protein